MAHLAERRLQDVFTCLRWKTTLAHAGRLLLPNAERRLKSAVQMRRLFADRPAWLRASLVIAERCRFDLGQLAYRFPRFPRFPVSPGQTQHGELRLRSFEGARHRYGAALPQRVRAQLEHELTLIAKLDLAGYFLIVHDIVQFAQREGMLVQGRGSRRQ